ncbi:hypothetical protein FS837_005425 [Tulasnella sp. UAMH 9824]|nr:hypothetical protein FS837_005425 [Tulasnella sp. UAMH 9824]
MSHHSDQRHLHGTEGPNFERQFWVASSQVARDFSSVQHGYHPYSRPSVEAPAEERDLFEDRQETGGYFEPQDGGTSLEGAVGVFVGAPGFAACSSGTQRTLDTTGPQNGALDGQKARPTGHFPHRFHRLFGDPKARGIIEWNEDGDEVIVVDHADNHAKPGGRYHVYYHQNFLRDHEELLHLIKPKVSGSDPPKTLIARLQKKLEELKMELSHSEAKISQLEKDKKRLEGQNKRLVDKNKRLEDENERLEGRNEKLEGRNERLHRENGRLEYALRNLQTRSSDGVAPIVPPMPLNYYQGAGNGHLQAGGAPPYHSQQWSYTNQALSNTAETINYLPAQQVLDHDLALGDLYSNLPHQHLLNTPGTMLSGSSGPCEVQPSGQEVTAAHAVGSQPFGSQVARQPSPKAPGVVHARSGVSVVSQQQPQSQETWFANLLASVPRFGSPSSLS